MKQRLASLFFFITLTFGALAGYASTWVINPDKIASFDETHQDQLVESLSRYKIGVIFDKALKADPSDLVPIRSQTLIPLVSGKYVSVYLVTPSLEELHIGLVVNDFSTLQGEALQEFRKMLREVVQTFQDMGYGDYLAFCDFGKTYHSTTGGLIKGNCWEMIPLGKGYVTNKEGMYQLAPKIWRKHYVLFDKTPHFKKENKESVSRFRRMLQSRLTHNMSHSPSFCKPTLPWTIQISDLKEAQQASRECALAELQKAGALYSSAPADKGQGHSKCPMGTCLLDRESCVFCKKEVITSEEMLRTKKMTVLYNDDPYTKNAHFMVIPLKHEESLHCLPPDQFDEMIQGAQKLNLALSDIKNLVWFYQNGPRAGQSVPHMHLHVLHRPDPVTLSIKVLNELAGNKDKPEGPKDYHMTQRWLLERFKTLGLDQP